jgi:hypothetical protein
MTQSAGRRAASDYLSQLLLKPGPYRRAWERHVVRSRHGSINQLAVAEVLAQYLSAQHVSAQHLSAQHLSARHLSARHLSAQHVSARYQPAQQLSAQHGFGAGEVRPHQLKDTVSRALTGRLLSKPALELFIDAFGFTDDEADRLRKLWNGTGAVRVLSGSHAVPQQSELTIKQALGPRRHQTLTMHDHVQVDADGRLARVRTMQVIEATVADTDRIPYLYDTSSLTVEVGEGCAGLSGELRRLRDDVFATEILLARSLGLGETTTVEYSTTFRFPGNLSDPREREYRRGVLGSLENFDLRIEFHSDKLPSGVWWVTWDGVDGPVLTEEPVTLDSLHAAQRYLRSMQRTVVGFRWYW